jgi:pilus assembly protein Flp/PilA
MKQVLARFATDATGATSIEYAMIASGIAVAIAGVVQGLGTAVKTSYVSVAAALK